MRTQLPVAAKIVVADSDVRDRTSIAAGLAAEGYELAEVGDGAAALATVERWRPDLLVVALTLAGMNAQSLCRQLRGWGSSVPVIVIAEKACNRSHMTSLDAGADDVIVKPIATEELTARIRAILRRSHAGPSPLLVVGDIELDVERRLVTRAGQQIELTRTEYSILDLLLRNVDIVLERATIYERVWGFDLHESSKSLDVHIGAIRRKLEQLGDRVIENVRGIGYVIRPSSASVTSPSIDLS